MSKHVYIEPAIPSYDELKLLLKKNSYLLSKEENADIFIRYAELTSESQKLPYAVFVERCENGKIEKTLFLHYADLMGNYISYSSCFHPKNTSGRERLFLFDESICMHADLPWDGNQVLGILDTLLKDNL